MDSELVKIDKLLCAEQWTTWKFQVKILLNANDLFEVVPGDDPKPPADMDSDKKVIEKKWLQRDRKAQKIIATTVGGQALIHIINCSTAQEMWSKLLSVYDHKTTTSINMLQQRFYSYEKDPHDDVTTHISKLETLPQQLREAGETVSNSMLTTKILMTLPKQFAHFFLRVGVDCRKPADYCKSDFSVDNGRDPSEHHASTPT